MQKHEREALEAVREILEPRGFSLSLERGRAKLHIWAVGHGVKEKKTISSSPRSHMAEVGFARRWAQRLARRALAQ